MAKEKEIVLIGAGKIGMGYVADLFNEAGYHLTFVGRTPGKIDEMNKQGYYTIYKAMDDGSVTRVRIENYDAYSYQTNWDACVKCLSETDLVSVQIYPNGTDDAAKMLAEAIKLRLKNGNHDAMDVFFCVNFVYVSRIFHEKIEALLDTDEQKQFLDDKVGLLEALTLRGGYIPTAEMLAEDPLVISASEGPTLPISEAFKGRKPHDVKGVQFIDRAEGRLVRKIWSGNMRHACVAAAGYYFDCDFTYQAANMSYVRDMTDAATLEANHAIGLEFGFTAKDKDRINELDWSGLQNAAAKDSVGRVLADPIRKLARNERFTGTAMLCLKHGSLPFNIARGAALLFLFDDRNDEAAAQIQDYIAANGIEKAVEKYCELDLDAPAENIYYELVVKHYKDLVALRDNN